MTQPAYYTLAEAARRLNVHPKTLRKAIRAGTIPVVRIGPKAVRIPAYALEPTRPEGTDE